MPTVPSYGGAQAAPSGGGNATFSAPDVINANPGQLVQAGAALERAGSTAASIAMDMQQQVNQVRVDDALNKARQKILHDTYDPADGYKNLKGDAALTRPDGLPLSEEYGAKLKTTISELAGSLGNDMQRQVFNQHANALMLQHQAGIEQHANAEYRSYALSTQDGTIKLGADEAKLNWQDPDKIKTSMDSVKAAVYRTSSLQGWSGSETTQRMKEVTSSVHMGVIDTAMKENNPEYAFGYMNKMKDEMTADDLLKVRGVITKDMHQRVADGIATNVVNVNRVRAMPTDGDRMVAITLRSESGGNDDAVGPYIPGQGTAKGKMQVMDATNLDPGYGVKKAADDSKAERARVGRDYLQAMVKEYAGDPAKAWAAYNWGPGNLDKAIKEYGDDWLKHAPEETQLYVGKNLAELKSGAGFSKPTLLEIHDQVRARVTAQYGLNPPPEVLKLALTGATAQFEDLVKATKADEDQRVINAMQGLQQNNGHFSRLSYSVRSQIPADKVDSVIAYGQKISKGDDTTNPAVYLKLSDPLVLNRMSDNEFYKVRSELSEADFKHFTTQRAAAQGKAADQTGTVNMGALNTALSDRLRALGLDPTPKDGSDEAVRLGTVKKHLIDTMLTQQKITGKQMTDADVEKHVDGQFAKNVGFRTSVLGIDTGRSDQRLLTMKAGDIPDDTREALLRDFKAHGVSAPTDGDLLGAYFKLKQMPFKAPKPRDTAQSKTGTIKY